jgi:hypothetical protein
VGNVVTGNGIDLAWTGTGSGNLWIGNIYKTSNVPLPA